MSKSPFERKTMRLQHTKPSREQSRKILRNKRLHLSDLAFATKKIITRTLVGMGSVGVGTGVCVGVAVVEATGIDDDEL